MGFVDLFISVCDLVDAVTRRTHVYDGVGVGGIQAVRRVHEVQGTLVVCHRLLIGKRPVPQHIGGGGVLGPHRVEGVSGGKRGGHLDLTVHVHRLVEAILSPHFLADALRVKRLVLSAHRSTGRF